MTASALLRLLLLAAIWGASFMFLRVTVPQFGASLTTMMRVMIGTAGLAALVIGAGHGSSLRWPSLRMLTLGAINSGIPFLLFAFAAQVLPAGYSAILNGTSPMMAVLVGALLFGERITLRAVGGVALGFVGVALVSGAGTLRLDQTVAVGLAAGLAASACYGFSSHLARRWIAQRSGAGALAVACESQVGAMLVCAPVGLWQLAVAPPVWTDVTVAAWLSVLALGLICTALAYRLYFPLIAELGAVGAMSVAFPIPLFGVLWGALFLGERMSIVQLAGGLLVVISMVLTGWTRRPRSYAGRSP